LQLDEFLGEDFLPNNHQLQIADLALTFDDCFDFKGLTTVIWQSD